MTLLPMLKGWTEFNVNHEVAVRLTEDGLSIMRRNHDRLNAGGLFPGNKPGLLGEFTPPKTDEDGWTRFQLWSLMREFGADIIMGRPVPFETTIRLDPSALASRDPEAAKRDSCGLTEADWNAAFESRFGKPPPETEAAKLLERARDALQAMMDTWFDYHDSHSLTQPVTGASANAFDMALEARDAIDAALGAANTLEQQTWRCVHCKLVVAGEFEPERCEQCSGRTFAKCDRAQAQSVRDDES